jgi:hypothetical protein
MADVRGFRIALDSFKGEIQKAGKAFVAEVALQSLTQIVQNSPVGNPDNWQSKRAPRGYVGGAFRRDWQLEVNQRPTAVATKGPSGDTGGDAINAAVSKLLGLPSLDTLRAIYITNTRPYAEPLENGWSRQAPRGVVAPAKAAIEARYGGKR